MENRTQFNLDSAIATWRTQLGQSPQFRHDNVEELESHLLDSIAALRTSGLSEEEAFLIATRRLGDASALKPEFAKVNGREVWMDRLLWMTVGIQLFWVLSGVSSSLAGTAVIGGLASLGYPFQSDYRHVYTAGIIPALLLALMQLLVLGLAVGGLRRLVRPQSSSFSVLVGWFLRHPFVLGFSVVVGSVVLSNSAVLMNLFLLSRFSPPQFGAIAIAMNLAHRVVFLSTALLLATLTVFLARRRLRLS